MHRNGNETMSPLYIRPLAFVVDYTVMLAQKATFFNSHIHPVTRDMHVSVKWVISGSGNGVSFF